MWNYSGGEIVASPSSGTHTPSEHTKGAIRTGHSTLELLAAGIIQRTMWLAKALCLALLPGTILAAQSTKGIYDLLQRRMPSHTSSFELSLVDSIGNGNGNASGYDQYVVSSTSKGKILVQGTTLSALSSG